MKKLITTTLLSISLLTANAASLPITVEAETINPYQSNTEQKNVNNQNIGSNSSTTDEEYIGMQTLSIIPNQNTSEASSLGFGMSLFAQTSYTSTQILSKKDVRELYHNMKNVTREFSYLVNL